MVTLKTYLQDYCLKQIEDARRLKKQYADVDIYEILYWREVEREKCYQDILDKLEIFS